MEFIFVLALTLLLAKVFGEIAERLKLPSLLGELFAGVLLGPAMLNILHAEHLSYLAEIGVILLLFLAGFEHGSIEDLLKYKKISITLSVISSTLPALFVVLYSLHHGYSLIVSLFLAVALSATSMGISVRSLMGVNELDSRAGKTVMGSLIINDLTGLLLLTLVTAYASYLSGSNTSLIFQFIKTLFFALLFFAIFYLALRYLPKLVRLLIKFRVEEAQFTFAIVITLFMAYLAEKFGLSSIIGAFFAGVILSRSPVFENYAFVQKLSSLSYGFFIPLFFAITGSKISFDNIASTGLLAVKYLFMIATVQIFSAVIVAKIFRYRWKESFLVGLGMLPYGEVSLVVMSTLVALAKGNRLFGDYGKISELYSAMLILISLTIIITPILMKFVVKLFGDAHATRQKT